MILPGNLPSYNARLGRMDALEKLFAESSDRSFSGPPSARLFAARQGLWVMKNHPERGFLCGPDALESVREATGAKGPYPKALQEAHSTTNGTSLALLKRGRMRWICICKCGEANTSRRNTAARRCPLEGWPFCRFTKKGRESDFDEGPNI